MQAIHLGGLKRGIDRTVTRGAQAGTGLYDLVNAYITISGSVKKRPPFKRVASLSPLTSGLFANGGKLRTFASGKLLKQAFFTSQLYGVFVQEDADSPLVTGGSVPYMRAWQLQQNDADSPLVSGGSVTVLNLIRTIEYTTLNTQGPYDEDAPLVTGGSVQALNLVATVKYTTLNTQGNDPADSPLVTGGSVQALNLQVTTGYQTYNAAQADNDSPLVTGGSVTNLSLTKVA